MLLLAVLQDSLKHPATPNRAFLLALSFRLKSWGLSKVPGPLEKCSLCANVPQLLAQIYKCRCSAEPGINAERQPFQQGGIWNEVASV